ncbi:hypothetical protein M378DRAFT_171090 [Amanita muscaria Koide BX008]|uniref:Uncharacterized protein n=1 Tax=Amanita muscaria (strain Koide BX008) TaxID=946122 RepID=A0A0C2S5N9_AMAMK|nr:hypothetical protein M378DRAFT_171090 [Amanita muscaria Koide BX008]
MSSNAWQKPLVYSLLIFIIWLPSACTFISLSMPSDTSEFLDLLSNKSLISCSPKSDTEAEACG